MYPTPSATCCLSTSPRKQVMNPVVPDAITPLSAGSLRRVHVPPAPDFL
jgi:hypothetical protein